MSPYKLDIMHSIRWRVKYARRKSQEFMNYQRSKTLYRRLFTPGDLVFDVGGNVGQRALLFHKLGARVITMEPVKATYLKMLDNIGERDIVALRLAASDHAGNAIIHTGPNSCINSLEPAWMDGWRSLFTDQEWTGEEEISLTTLDALIAVYGEPRFVKIDVEGHELAVLGGLTRPVDVLSFEYSPFHIEPAFKCLDMLDRLGHYQYNYCMGEGFKWGLESLVDGREMGDILADRKGDRVAGDVYAFRGLQ